MESYNGYAGGMLDAHKDNGMFCLEIDSPINVRCYWLSGDHNFVVVAVFSLQFAVSE